MQLSNSIIIAAVSLDETKELELQTRRCQGGSTAILILSWGVFFKAFIALLVLDINEADWKP